MCYSDPVVDIRYSRTFHKHNGMVPKSTFFPASEKRKKNLKNILKFIIYSVQHTGYIILYYIILYYIIPVRERTFYDSLWSSTYYLFSLYVRVYPTADPTGIQQVVPIVLLYSNKCHSLSIADRRCAAAQMNPLKHNVPFIVFRRTVCVVERPNRCWSCVIELPWSETR
jgi:hypothetical protein